MSVTKDPTENIKFVIKRSLNLDDKNLSQLEKDYEDKLVSELSSNDANKRRKWITYNQLVVELKMHFYEKHKELQYKLTDNSFNPTNACIWAVNELNHTTDEIERLYNKIKDFNN